MLPSWPLTANGRRRLPSEIIHSGSANGRRSPKNTRVTSASITPEAMATFWITTDRARRARRTAKGSAVRSSDMSTTSALSIAASLPAPPIAMPTVARASAGASLTPSPTMATAPCLSSSSPTTRTLSSGSSAP